MTGPGHTASETHIQDLGASEPPEPRVGLRPKRSRSHWLYELPSLIEWHMEEKHLFKTRPPLTKTWEVTE